MKIILTSAPELPGGEALNPANGFVEELRKALPNPCRGLFVCSSPDSPDKNALYSDILRRWFEASGFRFSAYDVLDRRNADAAAALVRDAELIYLAGGHVPTQNTFFAEIGLKELLRDFDGVLVGCSAGSMNSAETVYVHPELDGEAVDPEFARFRPGLGLTKTMILPHIQDIRNDVLDGLRVIEDIALPDSFGREFLALPDGSYLLIENGSEVLRGEAFRIKDGAITPVR